MSDLDPIIHAPARLRIMTTLASLKEGDAMTFPRLRSLLDMTAGNLSTHLTRLEDHDYVRLTKTFERRTPVTYIALTPTGRAAYSRYLTALRTLLAGPRPDPAGKDPT